MPALPSQLCRRLKLDKWIPTLYLYYLTVAAVNNLVARCPWLYLSAFINKYLACQWLRPIDWGSYLRFELISYPWPVNVFLRLANCLLLRKLIKMSGLVWVLARLRAVTSSPTFCIRPMETQSWNSLETHLGLKDIPPDKLSWIMAFCSQVLLARIFPEPEQLEIIDFIVNGLEIFLHWRSHFCASLLFTYCTLNQKNVYIKKGRRKVCGHCVSFLFAASLNRIE